MKELVSIITPAYNTNQFIEECINSVINQTYKNWEMIIVDDFSNDNTRDKIEGLASKETRIKTIFLNSNVGAANARNKALKVAKGKYIAFLDADDYWVSTKLEKQILFMNDNKVAFSFTAYQPISEDGRRLFSVINVPLKVDYKNYLKNTIIGCLTVMINIETIGKFTMPDLRTSHDMALWLSIMKKGYCAYGINENLARYRIVSDSNTASKIMAVKDVWNVYRNVEKLNFFYSFYCLIYYIVNALIKRI